MPQAIIKIEDGTVGNLHREYFFGLNIFPDGHPRHASLTDPRLNFLREICRNNRVSANTGSLFDFAKFPEELFGRLSSPNLYEIVRIGVYGGNFYDSSEWNLFPPLFFPRIQQDFLDIEWSPRQGNDKSLVFSIIYSDALALFISPKTEDSESELQSLLNQPFTVNTDDLRGSKDFLNQPQTDFLERAATLYEIVLTTQADGDYFECYSQDSESFELIKGPLSIVIADIKESVWFKENEAELIWDDEYSKCLIQNKHL